MATKSYWQQFHRQRISRRRLLTTVGATGAGLAVVAACGGGGDGDGDITPSPDGDAVRGGTLKFSVTADWGTIDPVTSVGSGPGIFARVYNVLLDRSRRQPDFFFFDLAESFEQPDPETYIFTMRDNAVIAPNDLGIPERPMDAMDVVSWLERVQEDENAVIRGFTTDFLDPASVQAPDARTFQLKTLGPYAYFLFRIGAPLGGTIPPREFREQAISLEQQGVGAGPWVLRPGTYQENGRATVDRNPNYYRVGADGEPLPYIDSIEWTQILDRQPRRTAFLDKQIHTYSALDRAEMEGIRSQLADVVVVENPFDTYIALNMKPTSPPWDNEKVRMAASAALNRQEYVDRIVGSDGGQINGLVHWPLGDFALPPEELATLQPFDPELSRRLIQEAGFELPLQVKIMYPVSDIEFHDQHLPIFLQQMEAGGFDIEEEALDFGTWLARYQNLEYDASLALNQIYETPEIDLDWHHSRGPQGDENFGIGIGTLFPEIDEVIEATKRVTDPAEQIVAIQDAQRQIYEKGPSFLPIMSWINFGLRHGFIKGATDGLGGTGLYLTPEQWIDQSAL